jgi:hypothetical protein
MRSSESGFKVGMYTGWLRRCRNMTPSASIHSTPSMCPSKRAVSSGIPPA